MLAVCATSSISCVSPTHTLFAIWLKTPKRGSLWIVLEQASGAGWRGSKGYLRLLVGLNATFCLVHDNLGEQEVGPGAGMGQSVPRPQRSLQRRCHSDQSLQLPGKARRKAAAELAPGSHPLSHPHLCPCPSQFELP